ncbi:unnamed protein product [Macrosiphum euphorbiae]|uniref:Uncharacterized protein n=1 Tax=Macrosiphum euphorbiae TaxID=13131 RepID=A0AAV0VX04_9HEMI|nr:unnamed protein product [Macrosiphum euphorbiae]
MTEDRLSNLAILSIESNIAQTIDFDFDFDIFTNEKAQKMYYRKALDQGGGHSFGTTQDTIITSSGLDNNVFDRRGREHGSKLKRFTIPELCKSKFSSKNQEETENDEQQDVTEENEASEVLA